MEFVKFVQSVKFVYSERNRAPFFTTNYTNFADFTNYFESIM